MLGKATGSLQNIQRSQDMLRNLQRIGFYDDSDTRALLEDHFTQTLNNSTNILKIQDDGRIVREALLMGPLGGVKIETIWDGDRLITMKLFGGGR